MSSKAAHEAEVEPGCLRHLANRLDAVRAERVLLVADSVAMAASGAEAIILAALGGREVRRFDNFRPNPRLAEVEQALASLAGWPFDCVLAVGGGTALDVAKLINLFSASAAAPRETLAADLPTARAPLIAVPTTSGTGSEATHFAVVYIDGKKHSVAHKSLRPRFALVDANLTLRLPPRLTASSGLDALCQGLESLWSVRSTDASRGDAMEALGLAWSNLRGAYREPNAANRAAMSRAAYLAGRAIDVSRTTAGHALSYHFTSAYGVPHGEAVALTIGPLLAWTAAATTDDLLDPRGRDHLQTQIAAILQTMGASTPAEGVALWEQLLIDLDAPRRLSQVGVDSNEAIEQVADSVNLERLANHPRRLDREALREMLHGIR